MKIILRILIKKKALSHKKKNPELFDYPEENLYANDFNGSEKGKYESVSCISGYNGN